MIGPNELLGSSSDDVGDVMRLAFLGALKLRGTVTSQAFGMAREFGAAWARGDEERAIAIVVGVGLTPDDVLPQDDRELARVIEAGQQAEQEGAP